MNSNENNGSRIAQFDNEDSVEAPRLQNPLPTEPSLAEDRVDAQPPRAMPQEKAAMASPASRRTS